MICDDTDFCHNIIDFSNGDADFISGVIDYLSDDMDFIWSVADFLSDDAGFIWNVAGNIETFGKVDSQSEKYGQMFSKRSGRQE
ncbi:MAG: hypothetical protein FWC50_11330 [Planctomycetaceae bacterium]|nr:hypothetical protein [Planctomycetaceae bacterium]